MLPEEIWRAVDEAIIDVLGFKESKEVQYKENRVVAEWKSDSYSHSYYGIHITEKVRTILRLEASALLKDIPDFVCLRKSLKEPFYHISSYRPKEAKEQCSIEIKYYCMNQLVRTAWLTVSSKEISEEIPSIESVVEAVFKKKRPDFITEPATPCPVLERILELLQRKFPLIGYKVEWHPEIEVEKVKRDAEVVEGVIYYYDKDTSLDRACYIMTHEAVEEIIKERDKTTAILINAAVNRTFETLPIEPKTKELFIGIYSDISDTMYKQSEKVVELIASALAPLIKVEVEKTAST